MIDIVNFAVEGNEIKFIKDYIKFLSINIVTIIPTKTDGWTNLHLQVIKNKFDEVTDKSGKNIVLFDADKDFKKRYQELQDIKKKLKIEFELF